MNAAKKEDDLWGNATEIVHAMYPQLVGYRLRMMAVEGGLRLWTGSRGELVQSMENYAEAIRDPMQLAQPVLDDFEREQTETLDPLPNHHLVVMERDDPSSRVVLNILSAAFESLQKVPLPEFKITPKEAEAEIVRESYTILPSGRSVVCELTTHNGNAFIGYARVVHAANFDFETGKKVARADAIKGVYDLIADRKRDIINELDSHL